MKLDNQNVVEIITQKFWRCSELLVSIISAFGNAEKWSHEAWFDYDPISNAGFIETLLAAIEDKSLRIVYVNIDRVDIQKEFFLEMSELNGSEELLEKFRMDHALLHDCSVEGSCYLAGESGNWVVFYNAELDAGVIFSNNNTTMIAMSDYVIQ